MNYIELINNFWKVHKEYNFSPIEIALYFYLLDVSNGLGWKNPFNQANTFIVGILGISEKTLYNARKTLEEAGLIEFESGNGRRYKSSYFLKGCNSYNLSGTLSEEDSIKGLPKGSNKNNLSGENAPVNNKLNKTKLNNNINTGETNVSQHAPYYLFSDDSKDDYLANGITTPPGEEKPLNGKLEENNALLISEERKEKSCAKKEKKITQFKKPTFEEVAAYCEERNNNVDPQRWLDYYTSNGWKVGKNSMKDWKAAVRTWERNGVTPKNNGPMQQNTYGAKSKIGSLISNIEDVLR